MLKRKREQKDYKLPNHEDVWFSLINDQALETIELYVRACPDILKIENEYGNALDQALSMGYELTIDKLLDLAAEVNCTFPMVGYDFWADVFEQTQFSTEITNKIIDACEDLTAEGNRKEDSLTVALNYGVSSSQYILSKMIEKEIFNVNHRDSDGRTYLMFASRDYNEDVL